MSLGNGSIMAYISADDGYLTVLNLFETDAPDGQERLLEVMRATTPADSQPSIATVATVSRALVRDRGLDERIGFLDGDAREIGWPGDNDLLLMSYLLSAVAESSAHELLGKAYKALRPGGRLLIHDFVVDDDGTGPPLAALWLLTAVTIDADVATLTPGWLAGAARRAGFEEPQLAPVIPVTTRLLTARR